MRRLCLSIVMLTVLGVLPARPLRAQTPAPFDAGRNVLHRVVDSHLEQLRQDSARVTAEVRSSVKAAFTELEASSKSTSPDSASTSSGNASAPAPLSTPGRCDPAAQPLLPVPLHLAMLAPAPTAGQLWSAGACAVSASRTHLRGSRFILAVAFSPVRACNSRPSAALALLLMSPDC